MATWLARAAMVMSKHPGMDSSLAARSVFFYLKRTVQVETIISPFHTWGN